MKIFKKFFDSFVNKCEVCNPYRSCFTQMKYLDGFNLMRSQVENGKLVFYAGSCPLNELEKHLESEDLYTIEHYFKCKCGRYYYTGYCIRGNPVLKSNEKPTKGVFKNLSGRYGEYFERTSVNDEIS